MKKLFSICLVASLAFASLSAKQKTFNECMYEFHKLENQLNVILYFGLSEQMDLVNAKQSLDAIELYPEETYEFELYVNKLKAGYDKNESKTYFLDKAKEKERELFIKSKECERLKND